MRSKSVITAALSFCLLLTGCGTDDTGTAELTATAGTSGNTEIYSETKYISETTAVSKTVSEYIETASEVPESTASETAETKSETTETQSLSEFEQSETTTEYTETASISQTVSEYESISETSEVTETTTTAAPAEVVIPEVKTPLASGVNVITSDNAEVDYGNASDGYISAVYSGSAGAAKLRIKVGEIQYDHDLATGGKREFFPIMGSGSYTVKVYEQVSGKNYAEVLSGEFSATVSSETVTYLYPNKYVNFSGGSACVKKAAELCAGKSDEVEKIAAIFNYISENIVYDKTLAATVKSGYVPDPDKTLASGKGICFDYASLFAAMCRSQNIPTRLVIGYAEPNIYHAWNEVYTDETGWITPELYLRKKGYNIADATFYAGNSDKEKIAEYISNDGNYSAMYRY